MMKPLVRDAPPLLREKDVEAGLLAFGSSCFARLPGKKPVARWGKDSPITVAGAAPDFESGKSRNKPNPAPDSLSIPLRGTINAASIGTAVHACQFGKPYRKSAEQTGLDIQIG